VFHAVKLKYLTLLEHRPSEGTKTDVASTNNVLEAATQARVERYAHPISGHRYAFGSFSQHPLFGLDVGYRRFTRRLPLRQNGWIGCFRYIFVAVTAIPSTPGIGEGTI
jgi:nucleoside-diphosphate-sugar epimerase